MMIYMVLINLFGLASGDTVVIEYDCLPEIPRLYRNLDYTFYLILEIKKVDKVLEIKVHSKPKFFDDDFPSIRNCDALKSFVEDKETIIFWIFYHYVKGWIDGKVIKGKREIPLKIVGYPLPTDPPEETP